MKMDKIESSLNKKYEKLMEEIGDFGKFQKRLCLLLVLSTVPNGYFAMAMVFVGRTPPTFRCFVPDVSAPDNATATPMFATSEASINTADGSWKTTTVVDEVMQQCTMVTSNGSKATAENATEGNATDSCPYGYIYDGFEEGRTSIVTEWNLVCDRAWIMPLIMSIYMAGVVVGSMMSGSASDRFGRYPTFLVGTLLMFLFLGLCGVATSPAMFTAFLFGAGALGFVNYVTAFIIAAEMINAKDRVVTGTLTVGGFAGGYMLLPLFALYIGNWRTLCFVLASLGIVFVPYIWLMTESPRWLFSKGRKEEFTKLFLKIAKTNGVTDERAKELITAFYKDTNDGAQESLLSAHDVTVVNPGKKSCSSKRQYSYLDLLRYGVVRSRAFCMWFTWFVCAVVYFGVAFNTSDMGGNPYINCFVAAAVEIPAYATVIALLKWRGRKPILITSLLVAGLSCTAAPYLKKIDGNLGIAFAMIGKLAISGAFSIIYIVCSELFPTLMRSMGVGSSSMAARVGGMVAPYMLYIGKSYEEAPYLIMGILAAAAALVNTILPETGKSALPESVDDLEPLNWTPCLKKGKLMGKKHIFSAC